MSKRTPASPGNVQAIEHQTKAIELRMAGATYDQISKALSCSLSTAHGYVQKGLAVRKEQRLKSVDQYVEMELNRLDRLTAVFWVKALGGDYKAAERVERYSKARRELLGLDGAIQVQPQAIVVSKGDSYESAIAKLEALKASINPEDSATPAHLNILIDIEKAIADVAYKRDSARHVGERAVNAAMSKLMTALDTLPPDQALATLDRFRELVDADKGIK